MTPASRLALGTAQFGMDYGIANRSGQIGPGEAERILELALASGIDTLDTAVAYGEAERVLGEIGVSAFRVVSKLPGLDPEVSTENVAGWVRDAVEDSLGRLGISHLDGLLMHRPLELASEEGEVLAAALCDLRDEGLVIKLGVSVYRPEGIEVAAERLDLDLVQSPFNVLDRRLHSSGWLERLDDSGVEIHARSVFLQGMLLMASRPRWSNEWVDLWQAWDEWLAEHGVSPLAAALGFVTGFEEVDRVVVGVDSAVQLAEIVTALSRPVPDPPVELACNDEALINPARWPGSA